MKKKIFYFFYFFSSIILFAFEPLPKICIGETELYLRMKKKEVFSKFGEPSLINLDVKAVQDEYSSIKIVYSDKELIFYYNKGNEEIHTIKAKQDFFLFLENGVIISKDSTIHDLKRAFSDIYKITETTYTISFEDNESSIITDDIYFYFGTDGKLEQIMITNDYY